MAKRTVEDLSRRFLSQIPKAESGESKENDKVKSAEESAPVKAPEIIASEVKETARPVSEKETAEPVKNPKKQPKKTKEETITHSFRVRKQLLDDLRIQAGYRAKGDISAMVCLGADIITGLDTETYCAMCSAAETKQVTPAEVAISAIREYVKR